MRYLGKEGADSRLRASFAMCPAYDIRDAFLFVQRGYDRYLTRKMVDFFLRRNCDVLGAINGFEHCAASMTMAEFHERLHPLAGHETREAYYLHSNPMEVARHVTVPVLIINSADDPVCVQRNVHRHRRDMQQLPRFSLALTRHGSHCGFFESFGKPDSWADRAIAEYLAAAHKLLGR